MAAFDFDFNGFNSYRNSPQGRANAADRGGSSWNFGDMIVGEMPRSITNSAGYPDIGRELAVYKPPAGITDNSQLNGTPYSAYDPDTGEFIADRTWQGLGDDFLANHQLLGALLPIAIAGGAAAAGLGAGGTVGATGGSGAFLGEGVASGIPAWDAAAGIGAGGLGGGLASLGGKVLTNGATSVLPKLFGGGSGGSNGMGGFNLGDLFNVGAGLYGSQKQGEAANKFMDFMNNNMNYVRNYGTEGTPEFNYLKKTLEAKDAAAGRNSQYGTRSVDLLGQLGQAKLDATSRMALGFASPYQRALNQDANKYAGMPAAINKLFGDGMGVQNLSSILNGLGTSTGINNNDFIDALNSSGSMPEGVPYDPNTMPTEQDIMDFISPFDMEDWLGF